MDKLPDDQHNALRLYRMMDRTNVHKAVPLVAKAGSDVTDALVKDGYVALHHQPSVYYILTDKGNRYRQKHFPVLAEEVESLRDEAARLRAALEDIRDAEFGYATSDLDALLCLKDTAAKALGASDVSRSEQ